jgi:hypothetical protein
MRGRHRRERRLQCQRIGRDENRKFAKKSTHGFNSTASNPFAKPPANHLQVRHANQERQ